MSSLTVLIVLNLSFISSVNYISHCEYLKHLLLISPHSQEYSSDEEMLALFFKFFAALLSSDLMS